LFVCEFWFPRARAQGDLLMLMGTAEAVAEGPSKPVLFEEDLTDAQKSRLSDSGALLEMSYTTIRLRRTFIFDTIERRSLEIIQER
jgi:hypothetical protein